MKLRAVLLTTVVVFAVQTAWANTAAEPTPGFRQARAGSPFHKLNAALKANPSPLLFVGDSTTQFWATTGAKTWEERYAPRDAMNLGIAGEQTQHILWRLTNGHLEHADPKAIVLQAGTNNLEYNTNEEIVEGVAAIVNAIVEQRPDARVLLLAIFPRDNGDESFPERIQQINSALESTEWPEQVRFKNINDIFMDENGQISPRLMLGFRELTREGYEAWAQAIEDDIAEFLGE